MTVDRLTELRVIDVVDSRARCAKIVMATR